LNCAWDEVVQCVDASELVRPLDIASDNADLVGHVLLPLDRSIASARSVAVDGVRRTTGQDDHACLSAHRVVDVATQVLRADVDVDHHQLRLPRHQKVPVRSRHGHVFEQAWHQRWHALAIRH
jgi:hypothetical protein